MEKYQKIRVLGKGSFGSAILIKRKNDGALFVVKEVSLLKMSQKEKDEARHECTVLQQLQHPNIVRYVEQFENRNNLYIVMEYCDGGDLAEKVKQSRGPMKESTIMYYFSQICLAMEYLHSRHIIHRDIKTMNVFLMKNGAVKLGDFGISTVLRNTMGMANTVCGTPYYFSPELCRNKPYNNKSDIWALGVLLYECATGGRHPFDGNSMNQLMQRIVKGNYAPISSKYSPEFRKMVDWCLQKDHTKRPSIKQLLAYPLMRDSLDQLEQNLMLATQCKIRLNDIIDFETGMDNRHESPSTSPRAEVKKIASPGMSPGQAAAMAMAKQMSPTSPAARPQSPGALVSPKPGAAQKPPSSYQDQIMDRVRQQYGRPGRSPSAAHELVPIEKNVDPRNANDPRLPRRSDDVAERANRFDADMKRVDAIIAKYGKNVDPSAKETIHAFMRRKQEEYMQRQKEEAEKRERRNDLRQKELQRVLEQQRNLASPGRPRSPQRSPMRMRAESESVPLSNRAQTPPAKVAGRAQSGQSRDLIEGRRQRLAIAANSPRLLFEKKGSESPSAVSPPTSRPTSPSRQLGQNSDPTSASERAKAMRLQIEEKKRNQAHGIQSPPLSPRKMGNRPPSPQYNYKYNANYLEPLQQKPPTSPSPQAESPRHRLGVLPPVSSGPSLSNGDRNSDPSPQDHQDANKSPSRGREAVSPRSRQYLAPQEKTPSQPNSAVPSTLDSLRGLRNEKKEAEPVKPMDKLALLKQRQSLPSRRIIDPSHRDDAEGKPKPLSPSAVDNPSRGSPRTPPLSSPRDRSNSVDGYSEMLQHLKDLLQKRRIYHDNKNVPLSPSREGKGVPLSPPNLLHTKPSAHALLAPLNGATESSDDDDFEDALPLSPVRCTELNDTYTKKMQEKEKEAPSNVYTADAFLHGKGEKEEELDEDGYTGYYQVPSKASMAKE